MKELSIFIKPSISYAKNNTCTWEPPSGCLLAAKIVREEVWVQAVALVGTQTTDQLGITRINGRDLKTD